MFKDIRDAFTKFFTKERVIILLIFIVLAWALLSYSGSKSMIFDNMETMGTSIPTGTSVSKSVDSVVPAAQATTTTSSGSSNATSSISGSNYTLQPVANPADLLPTDSNSQWAALNPNTMNQGNILMPDLLQAGYHIGLDTIGQTLRNPNLQLRSDPLIPKNEIGPWNQSTIEPDIGRVPLEIGQCK